MRRKIAQSLIALIAILDADALPLTVLVSLNPKDVDDAVARTVARRAARSARAN